jgi:hypothetical protein
VRDDHIRAARGFPAAPLDRVSACFCRPDSTDKAACRPHAAANGFFAGPGVARFNLPVPDVIVPASSGRAKCRGCGRPIEKGELRFGESLPNAFAEGETLFWFHLACGACMRPEKFGALLTSFTEPLPNREWLERTAATGVAHRRLPRLARAERASSGRATCRHCRELIEKGTFRIALQMFEDTRMSPIGFIHLTCSEGYFGVRELVDRIEKLSPELSEADLAEIQRLIDSAPPAARLAKTRPAEDDAAETSTDDGVDAKAH